MFDVTLEIFLKFAICNKLVLFENNFDRNEYMPRKYIYIKLLLKIYLKDVCINLKEFISKIIKIGPYFSLKKSGGSYIKRNKKN